MKTTKCKYCGHKPVYKRVINGQLLLAQIDKDGKHRGHTCEVRT